MNDEITVKLNKNAAGASQDAAREIKNLSEMARMAALSAGQATVVAHVAAHALRHPIKFAVTAQQNE